MLNGFSRFDLPSYSKFHACIRFSVKIVFKNYSINKYWTVLFRSSRINFAKKAKVNIVADAFPVNPLVTNVFPYQYAVLSSPIMRPPFLPVNIVHLLLDDCAVGIMYFPQVVVVVSFLSSGPVAFIVLRSTAGRVA